MVLKRLFYIFCYSVFLLANISSSVFTIKAVVNDMASNISNISTNVNVDTSLPIVINTWPFTEASAKAWEVLVEGGSALDAVEQGCTICEELQCDGTVGFGGSPDENGETTLDAMIMDGETHDVGAVGALRRIKSAISVARKIMEKTEHTLLVGSQATDFAKSMGFREEDLTTPASELIYKKWILTHCQPNFWKDVSPDPARSCGPYQKGNEEKLFQSKVRKIDQYNHDTIGMVAIDLLGQIAGGTSTNGARHKIPGRVGDSPIPGSGAYVDRNIGGAAATGDGDIMMRFMPSLVAVDFMRMGLSPESAAKAALERIVSFYPMFSGAVVTLHINGTHGAACYNLPSGIFNYTLANFELNGVEVLAVTCFDENQSIITENSIGM